MVHDEISEDKRSSPRRRVDIPCAIELSGAVLPGKQLDLSDGGCFVQTDAVVASGTALSIIFQAGLRGEIVELNLKSKVVYVGRFVRGYENFRGFGARFDALPDETAAKLTAMLESPQSETQRRYEFM
jgi:hypothetical protein